MATTHYTVDAKFIESMEKHRQPVDKSKGLLWNCSRNVVLFADKMLGVRLYSWQVEFLRKIQDSMHNETENKEFLAMTSRQIGKSTAVAVLSLWSCVFNKYPGTVANNTTVGIVSASDTQARKLLSEMRKLYRLGDKHMKESYLDEEGKSVFGPEFFSSLIDDKAANNTTTISFKSFDAEIHGDVLLGGPDNVSRSGSVIKSYPPTSAILGETFSMVIIDEAGKTDRITDEFFYDYCYPTGNSTNAIRIYTSTPWLSSGFFYRLIDPDNLYPASNASVSVFTIDAINIENSSYRKVVQKTIDEMNADGKTDEVQRAYFCRFVKGESSYFDRDDVLNAFTDEYTAYEGFQKPCDMGVDFGGQVNSRTVITISHLDENDNKVYRIFKKVYDIGKDDKLIEDIQALMKDFNIERIIPDDCPAGYYLIRQMIDKGWNVNPMSFRAEKVKKYGAFRSMLHKGMIVSFKDDDLLTEMLALEYSHHKRQSVIEHAPGYSDDLIDSWLMSTYFFVAEDTGVKTFDWEVEDDKPKRGRLLRRSRRTVYGS